MSICGEIFLHCDGEETLDVLFRCDREVQCEMVLGGTGGGVEIEHSDFAEAQSSLKAHARSAGWKEVKVPPLLRDLEELWNTTGDRVGHLCPVCEATRVRSLSERAAHPRTAWDTWTVEDVERRAREIEQARRDHRDKKAGDQ